MHVLGNLPCPSLRDESRRIVEVGQVEDVQSLSGCQADVPTARADRQGSYGLIDADLRSLQEGILLSILTDCQRGRLAFEPGSEGG